jgi:hypothetical protein
MIGNLMVSENLTVTGEVNFCTSSDTLNFRKTISVLNMHEDYVE